VAVSLIAVLIQLARIGTWGHRHGGISDWPARYYKSTAF